MSKIAVVFIHGFTGGEDTWKNSKNQYFKDILNQDLDLQNHYDFYEFEYYTKITSMLDSVLIQRSKLLLNKLPFLNLKSRVRKNKPIIQLSDLLGTYLRTSLSQHDEVVLIGHSMGGLVAKACILNSLDDECSPKVKGYVSIAVPHKGSIGALLISTTQNVNAKELKPLSEYNDQLNSEWTDRKEELPPSIYIIATDDECVSKVSSVPYKLKKSVIYNVEHDHLSVCKPESRNEIPVIAVRDFLKHISHDKMISDLASQPYNEEENSYDKEIFVIKMILCDIGEMGIKDAKESFFSAEIISRAVNRQEKDSLRELQRRVLSIYRQTYNNFNKPPHTPNEIFYEVHNSIVSNDKTSLETSVKHINFLHKKGMLHQLANRLDGTVIWSDKVTLEKISEAQ